MCVNSLLYSIYGQELVSSCIQYALQYTSEYPSGLHSYFDIKVKGFMGYKKLELLSKLL